ncbi:MAG: dTDP-4-dehydrorhamnose reductase, partial [Chloroflexi bacterium]|nr:dTDP-4-dehydrorhamnose reductase [Chloroflexota bacterium]
MRIVITGSKGQLGTSLNAAFSDAQQLEIDLPEYDITRLDIVET